MTIAPDLFSDAEVFYTETESDQFHAPSLSRHIDISSDYAVDRAAIVAAVESRFGADWREAVAELDGLASDGIRWRHIIADAAGVSSSDWRYAVMALSGTTNWRKGLLTIGDWLPFVIDGNVNVFPGLFNPPKADDQFYSPTITPPPAALSPDYPDAGEVIQQPTVLAINTLNCTIVSDDDTVIESFVSPGSINLISAALFDLDRDYSFPATTAIGEQDLTVSLFVDSETFYTIGDNDIFYSPSIS
jgi:hypothetical protein